MVKDISRLLLQRENSQDVDFVYEPKMKISLKYRRYRYVELIQVIVMDDYLREDKQSNHTLAVYNLNISTI